MIVVTKGEWVYNMPAAFQFAQRDILGLAVPIWLMIILVSVAAIWMRYYPVGRRLTGRWVHGSVVYRPTWSTGRRGLPASVV